MELKQQRKLPGDKSTAKRWKIIHSKKDGKEENSINE